MIQFIAEGTVEPQQGIEIEEGEGFLLYEDEYPISFEDGGYLLQE